MSKTKSIGEKIADTMKDIASIAADAADHALKTDKAPPKVNERPAAYIPLAADGLVSDPMMVPPIAAAHAPPRKRAAASRRTARPRRKTRARRRSGNLLRSPRGKPQPGGRGAPPKPPPRGKPAGKRPRKRGREIAERAEASHRGAISV
jgi:hypothetical protein